ncbi:glycoside hydrolase family 3 C-terminal domain-containing protein [Echinicola jeungdonensis]|uniref:Glycoside hydrolase family 3 C-terminal domain-containing protein n=1 Tax=Echinicola jeungdonensis TaxID=709343 RepID=A0ABV5J371_9BACT|nr:glycoside hydrolase family 3 C-terminal domain-containing protein [Echinicola jeungdonensis]MDN3668923.1 glycoside hydrolase family 3 C-terminal domain-containing protein [Echinicola jeungdonensis]
MKLVYYSVLEADSLEDVQKREFKFFPFPLLLLLAFLLTNVSVSIAQDAEPDFSFLDTSKPFQERVDILVDQMTLSEKVSQLMNDAQAIPRLKVPQYNWWNECLHGVARAGYATVFPQSITVAASFDKALMGEIGTVVSDEARAKHHEFVRNNKRGIYTGLDFWSPNINIFRDPRWGRGHETYGEDPYLTGELASQFIIGLQGNDEKYLKTIATSKHFAVHSGPEPLRHSFDVDVSDRDLYETYFPAFRKTVKDAGVYSVMGAYNRFRGESCSGHDFLLNQVLRGDWGFDGYVVSDCGAIRDIHTGHNLASSEQEAAAIGIKGGCDLNCGGYYAYLMEAVEEGLVTEEVINTAVKRMFLARFRLGMFDPAEEVEFAQIPTGIVCSDAHNTLARKAAQESMVLLKNKNNLLPLSKEKLKRIAVIGPNADNEESLLGNYHGTPKNPVTFLEGIKNKIGPKVEVVYAEGAHLAEGVHNLKPIPSAYFQTEDGKQGLKAQYFNNTKWEGEPVLERIDDQINFSWQHQPISKELIDNFSIRWEGYLVPHSNGDFELAVFSKRGMKLLIDGKEISNGKGSVHEGRYATGKLHLEKGEKYKITVEYHSDESNALAKLLWARTDENKVQEAVQLTEKSDVAIVVLGLSQRLEGESMDVAAEGFEGGDRISIGLPKQQEELLKAIQQTGKPIILVLNAGSALAINWAKDNVEAILSAGYPGEEGGNALADVIFGDYNPGGRLPITYYQSVDDLPPFEDYDMEGRTYRYFGGQPLYPFGYGLSYTEFEYSDLKLPAAIEAGEELKVSVSVKNVGERDGDEVVQLYLRDVKGSTLRPLRQLEGFERIHLEPGQSQEVEFTLTPRQLSMINKQSKRVIENGTFEIYVGGEQPGFTGTLDATTTEVLKGQFKVNKSLVIEDL